jgi:hypothetical protein
LKGGNKGIPRAKKACGEMAKLCLMMTAQHTTFIMPGLDPGIHRSSQEVFSKSMDCRVKPGNDEYSR